MSCKNSNTPINIEKTSKTCNSTCNLSYSYGYSSLNVLNRSNHLKFSYDGDVDVTFNGENYSVEEIRLYSPSLNKYYGSNVDAELFIHHTSMTGNNLMLCIPIEGNDARSNSNALFSQIMPIAPTEKEGQKSINISKYTLNNLIPLSEYYYYNGNLPYEPCTGNYGIIIFDTTHKINISTKDLSILRKLIKPSNPVIKNINNVNYFYNKKGTIQNNTTDDDIYIDCQPVEDTGESQDQENQGVNLNNLTSFKTSTQMKNLKTFEIIGGLGVGLIIGYKIYKGLINYLNNL